MFSVLHANHLEDLRDLSLALMQRQRLPPLTPETFLVQSNGMAQWLRLSLAEADGVAASVDFPLPSSFVWRAYRAVLEREGAPIPQHSPFDKRPLAWRILRLLESRIEAEPEVFAPLAHYLSADAGSAAGALSADAGSAAGALSADAGWTAGAGSVDTGEAPVADAAVGPGAAAEQAERKRWQLAVRLADLFDQYLNYRPDWLAAWEQGETAPMDLPADQRWQPALWRALLEDADPAEREFHRARLHGRFVRAARALDTCPPGLPPRLFVFGISALPAQLLEALHALSGVIDVFLMITNPCRHYWGDIVSDREAIKRAGRLSADAQARQQGRHPEAPWLAELDEEALHLQANPLLAAWGAQGRDFIVGLYEFESQDGGFDVETDLFQDPATDDAPSLLAQIQQDVLDLRHPGELARERGYKRTIAAADVSLSLYRVHSPLREVEVLHDRLLAAFDEASAAGAPLRPRDILVMVPEIDTYAPYIEAVFGQYAADDPRHVPFTIADQVASETHPLMVLVLALLELPERRLGVSELLDALDVPALRARFGIDEGELPRLRQWLAESGVRWGLSASHRRALGFPALHENSWAFGLERMLLGYSTGPLPPESTRANATESAAWQFDAIVPFNEVGGLEADLAGRLAELVAALEEQRAALCTPGTPAEWRVRLGALLARMFQPAGLDEHDVLARVDQALGRWQASCELAAFTQPIGLGVVRDALKAELDEGGLAQRFLAGKVNFATLMPMRAIPFRHIYLLGMSDGAYPRTRQPQDFDLMAGRARPGDRSRRDDDRYLLLEALLSARDRLTLSWVGFDQRDNTPRPPSVLIGELLDMLEQGWQPAAAGTTEAAEGDDPERRLAERLIETHPLQPFSRRYFLADDPRFTYDASWAPLHGAGEPAAGAAEARAYPRTADDATAPAPEMPQPPAEALGLNDLQRLLRRPWNVYLGRLGVRFQRAEVPDEDSEPFTLDALEDHTLKRELLDAGRRGEPLVQVAERLRLAGRLPAAGFGQALIEPPLKRLSAQLASWRGLTATLTAAEPTLVHFAAPAAGTTPALALEARLDELYLGDEGAELITLETSHFGHFRPEGEGPWKKLGKPHRLHAGYLRWLLANAAGEHATAWSALFEDRVLRFPPLERALARETLAAWLACWWRAWCAPLPAAGELARTLWGQCGSDTLAALAAGEPLAPALHDTLAGEFESGNFQVEALIRREQALGQLWPDFDSFAAAGGVGESVRHYQPLLDAMRRATQRIHVTGERS